MDQVLRTLDAWVSCPTPDGSGEQVGSAVQLMVDYQLEGLPVVASPRRASYS
jgi:hypothetical protein